MRIPLLDGRDFRASDTNPAVAIVNQAFAKQYLQWRESGRKMVRERRGDVRFQIVGFVRDARSRDDMRRPIRPTAYVPFHTVDAQRRVRADGPRDVRGSHVAARTRWRWRPCCARKCRGRGSEFRVSNIRTQVEIDLAHTVRERLLAMLAMFFAARRAVARGRRAVWRAGLLAFCNGGARSAFAWRSARRPATSRGA